MADTKTLPRRRRRDTLILAALTVAAACAYLWWREGPPPVFPETPTGPCPTQRARWHDYSSLYNPTDLRDALAERGLVLAYEEAPGLPEGPGRAAYLSDGSARLLVTCLRGGPHGAWRDDTMVVGALAVSGDEGLKARVRAALGAATE